MASNVFASLPGSGAVLGSTSSPGRGSEGRGDGSADGVRGAGRGAVGGADRDGDGDGVGGTTPAGPGLRANTVCPTWVRAVPFDYRLEEVRRTAAATH
ncbi:hypothetical protein QQY66_40350 [Streptomyces sp. DG2A-72]|uniref:hypothetical protein n=1 Tax=Streptomyces sp. DG2A-72 TaxID=3051386 RepID=UPI00265C4333|nr:hypothetical protein [Streptomyces sp. DG2A-72]MDO0937679.1 hypothetical protein [Streptomyces sp. DG2A-72]